MFKRANKITALLVAAASIMSVVPAMAATKLGTKDGTIENAVAFKDGKYLYQGYKSDDEDSALYYNAGDKDKKLDNGTDIDASGKNTSDGFTGFGKFDKSLVGAVDGNDEYIVDLTNGTSSDDSTLEDMLTNTVTKLGSKLKKTDRYGKITPTAMELNKIDNNKFGDVWYEYTATTASGAGATLPTYTTTADAAQVYSGYVNQSGTYVDASKEVNAYVFNGTKMVKLENIGDTDDTDGVTVKLNSITPVKTLTQDDKYIYRLVKLGITTTIDATGATSNGVYEVANTGTITTADQYYVQKIAKAQGTTEKDAYLPKTTETYQIGAKTQLGDGDVSDAFDAITAGDSAYNSTGTDAQYYVVDGSLYVTFKVSTDDKVKTIKMNLKTSQKLKVNASNSTKVDGHVVVKDGDKDQKIETYSPGNSYGSKAWGVDVNGNVWAVKDGEVLESSKIGDFKTVYTVDRSFDRIDVYDDKDMIVWQDGGDAYTTVNEGTKQAADDAGAIVNPTPAKVGWDKLADGTWNFYDATGAKVANNWVNVGGAWYFLKADGVMATGWQQVGGTWYYLNASGSMATGWINDGGNWYYLNASGAMLANTTTPDGYYVGASGAWVK